VIIYRNNRCQGSMNIYYYLSPSEKWTFKCPYKINPLQSKQTYACLHGNSQLTAAFWNCSVWKTHFPAPLVIYQGAHRPAICTWRLNSVLTRFRYKTIRTAGNNRTKSWKYQYSQHRPRRGSTQKVQKAHAWWWSGIWSITCLDQWYSTGGTRRHLRG
jgi:hypothetical protein